MQRGAVDKSIRGEFNCIRFKYKTELDMAGWIRRCVNPADVGTMENSPLTDTVVLMLATGFKPSICLLKRQSRMIRDLVSAILNRK